MKTYNENIIVLRLQNELGLSDSKARNLLACYAGHEDEWRMNAYTHSMVVSYIVEKYREAYKVTK